MPIVRMTEAELAKYLHQTGVVVGPTVGDALARLEGEKQAMPRVRREKPKLARESVNLVDGRLVIVAAVETTSEINQRIWRAKHRRTGAAWTAVRSAIAHRLDLLHPFARHYVGGGQLKVTFTRIGGRRLDTSNLPTATKACEDAIAYLLGANDADPRWSPRFGQEPGEVGVRIEVEMA